MKSPEADISQIVQKGMAKNAEFLSVTLNLKAFHSRTVTLLWWQG